MSPWYFDESFAISLNFVSKKEKTFQNVILQNTNENDAFYKQHDSCQQEHTEKYTVQCNLTRLHRTIPTLTPKCQSESNFESTSVMRENVIHVHQNLENAFCFAERLCVAEPCQSPADTALTELQNRRRFNCRPVLRVNCI